jgi:cell division protein ZipA
LIPEKIVPKAKPLNLDEHVPLLMDVEELGDDVDVHEEPFVSKRVETKSATLEKTFTENSINHNTVTEYVELTLDDIKGIQASVSDMGELLSVEQSVVKDEPSIAAKIDVPEIAEYDSRQQAQDMATQAAYAPVKKPGIHAEKLINRPLPSLVLVTHVIPHDEEGFCGEDILYLVNSCDLRHGEKEIFHRFEKENGDGCIQFSMANSFNPGTFEPETLLHERIHGVSLFMSLPGPEKAMDAFESMTEMASVIARNLGGEVHDETHSIMALQTIEHNRQLVRDFVRKQKLAGKK